MSRERRSPGTMPFQKYRPTAPVALTDRGWPDRVIERAPAWCSVDLRDGNQALVQPMGTERKRRLFQLLVEVGFKEIEVGFPSASQTEFDFVRELIEEDCIPGDVTIQVLTQAREDLIRRTFEAIRGARRANVHLYNSTSVLQRRVVFESDRRGIVDIAVRGALLVRELTLQAGDTGIVHQYSPESFTGTELDFAVEICEAVMDVWEPTPDTKMVVNLPATVEMATPNVYADQIEWFGRQVRDRESLVLSIHPHNDRGCAVAAAELALLAGGDRIEGTLFGNGERTGNVDVVTLALNLMSQGVDPQLDFRDMDRVVSEAEHCTRMDVAPRHPYAGTLVFTAFSGSHQDAIAKGLAAQADEHWEVPYLPIDPADVGRAYEAVIRINSQSGKGGIAYVMEQDHGLRLPRGLRVEFSRVVQAITDRSEEEVSSQEIWRAFEDHYLRATKPLELVDHRISSSPDVDGQATGPRALTADIRWDGRARVVHGYGNGPIDAFVDALHRDCGVELEVHEFSEHSVGDGADARAVAYVEVETADGVQLWGVGLHESIVAASLRAVACAANRARELGAAG